MAQSVTKVSDEEFHLEITDRDLAIFFRVFAQEPKEAVRIAALFNEEPLSFAAMSADNRTQILEQVNNKELFALVKETEEQALAELAD